MVLGKKGYIGPLVMGLLGLVFFSLALLVSVIVINNFSEELLNDPNLELREDVSDSVADMNTRLPQALDGIVLMILGGLVIGGLVFSYFVDYSPVMFFLVFFVSLALLLGPMLFSNLWGEVVSDPAVFGYQDQFTVTNFVMQNYPWLWFGFNTLFLFVFLGRDRFQ